MKVYSVAAFLVVWLALFIQPNNLTVVALDIVLVSSLSASSLPQLNETGKKLLFRDKKLRVSYKPLAL